MPRLNWRRGNSDRVRPDGIRFGWILNSNLPLALDTALVYVKGIGPARAAMLQSRGLETVEDLIHYFPFRYEDRSNLKTIGQLAPGELATVIAEVKSSKLSDSGAGISACLKPSSPDSSRAIVLGKWFHGGVPRRPARARHASGAVLPRSRTRFVPGRAADVASGAGIPKRR